MHDVTKNKSFTALWNTSHLAGANAPYLEQLYEAYLQDPTSIDARWRDYFDGLPRVDGAVPETPHLPIRESFRRNAIERRTRTATSSTTAPDALEHEQKQIRVLQLINAFRFRGHQVAQLDPINLWKRPSVSDLDPHFHGLSDNDLDTVFDTGSFVGPKRAPLRDILEILRHTYCGSIGAEYMHITETAEKRWIQSCLESARADPEYPPEIRLRLLDRLTAAEGLERYLHTKYVGQKRFSLEGAEGLIPMLDELVQRAGASNVKEVVVGMAHRGRLNVLVNIVGKTPSELFLEFEGKTKDDADGTGDVKYHLGFSSDIRTSGGLVHVALAFNPSHLEIVGPVVEGSVRARQHRLKDNYGVRVLPILIHGDAAFAGQGVVMETFNMSQARGYSTKGTIHIIVNNQIGFTTSHPQDTRSTMYSSDVAKMVNAPIFHVNGDDPEAVLFVAQIALDYRMTFRKDVVIDLVCYRRHGHSEADEPSVTQPSMYQAIRAKPTTRELYARQLIELDMLTPEDSETRIQAYQQALETETPVAPNFVPKEQARYPHTPDWSPYLGQDCLSVETGVSLELIRELSEAMNRLPEGFEPHPHVTKVYESRTKMAAGALPIDWGFAENLAYATLLKQDYAIRLSGQDSGRGTFFHRHAIVHNQKEDAVYVPLRNLYRKQPDFDVINSLLSEEAVLAFEYGYATADPKTLVIWEAQFGDFANNAQVVIDQFISAGEQKWNRLCGLTMFLPHGYEGQGPEHSSARLERYLQLCAQKNIVVCIPTTPAQFFHLIRRQMLWRCRKPLIVMTPKSLLRNRESFSRLDDLSQGEFQTLIPDAEALGLEAIKQVVMCAGKVYYDLLERRQQTKRSDVALIRIEQLYPFPHESLAQELLRYPNAERFVWCQEEPQNKGAWYPSQHNLRQALPAGRVLEYAGRQIAAASAVGAYSLHIKQLHDFLDTVFGPK